MREGFVKLALGLIAIASLGMGGVFLLVPEAFITVSEAESVNVAWLRSVGAGLVGVQGIGLLVATFRRRDTNPILLLTAIASSLQSIAGWYSFFAGEFSAQAQWAIVVPFFTATVAAVFLWVAWISRRRVAAGKPPLRRAAASRVADDAGDTLPAEEFADTESVEKTEGR